MKNENKETAPFTVQILINSYDKLQTKYAKEFEIEKDINLYMTRLLMLLEDTKADTLALGSYSRSVSDKLTELLKEAREDRIKETT